MTPQERELRDYTAIRDFAEVETLERDIIITIKIRRETERMSSFMRPREAQYRRDAFARSARSRVFPWNDGAPWKRSKCCLPLGNEHQWREIATWRTKVATLFVGQARRLHPVSALWHQASAWFPLLHHTRVIAHAI